MKKTKWGTIVLIATASLTKIASAQTADQIKQIQSSSNLLELRNLSEAFAQQHSANYAKAVEYAVRNNWPLTKMSGGSFQVLDGITEDDKPIYHQSLNHNAGIACRASRIYTGSGPLALNVHGEGMYGAIWDVGPIRITHQAYENRVVQIDATVTANTTFLTSHPSHVAGTIISSGNFQDGTARGIAFAANLLAYTSGNDRTEAAVAAGNGLLVSNHSYASDGLAGGFSGLYTSVAHDWDAIMWNAPYYLSVWACGNAGGPVTRLSNSSVNKNGIAVGSIAGVDYPTGYYSPRYSNLPLTLTPTSSAGPTSDMRIKPDIMAKGVSVYSPISDNDSSYVFSTGTSMAAPSVTGSVLLLQQLFQQKNGYFMKSATVKGLIIHSATETGAPGPKANTGWGLLNVENAAFTIVNDGGITDILEEQLFNGSSYTKTVFPADTCPLIITLCWTDPAGAGITDSSDHTPRLINDLDIAVTSNNATYLPWKMDAAGNSTQGNNSVDNVEKVQIFTPVPGQPYVVTISHKGALVNGNQNFSLICSGLDSLPAMPTYVSNTTRDDNTLLVFPNPNNGLFAIRTRQQLSGEIKVINMEGDIVWQKSFTNSNSINIDISNVAAGMYLIHMVTNKEAFKHIVVKR